MQLDKNAQFHSENSIWSYIPNNGHGLSLFDGDPIPSKSVLELIGIAGVNKIDEILKQMKRAKEIIYGVDSMQVCFSEIQYFAQIDKIPPNSEMNIKHIISNNSVIVCDCSSIDNSLFDGTHNDLKLERWDVAAIKNNIARFRDYIIYIIDDTNDIIRPFSDGQGKYQLKYHWEKILNDEKDTTQRFLGGEKGDFISDHIRGNCIDKLE